MYILCNEIYDTCRQGGYSSFGFVLCIVNNNWDSLLSLLEVEVPRDTYMILRTSVRGLKHCLIIMPPFEKGGAYCFAHVGRYVGMSVGRYVGRYVGRSVCRYPLTLCN